jgi:hypothetical protein
MEINQNLRKTLEDYSLQELLLLWKRRFSKGSLAEFNDSKPCVFVLSTGRVGSETFKNLISLSRNVMVFHEPRPELFSLSKSAYMLQNEYRDYPSVKEALLEGFWVGRRDLMRFVRGCDRGYVETGPDVTFLAGILAGALPYAKFIHLVRNPFDTIYSGMRRKWYAGHEYDNYRIRPLVGAKYADQWDSFSPFEKNVWLWTETNRWICALMSSLNPDRTFFIHSEDVFNGDQQKLTELFNFINYGFFPPIDKIKRVLGMKYNAQKTGDFPEQSKWTSQQKEFLLSVASETATRIGYDFSSL